jgi:xyloglucan-specific exo-beta-1,4-glucanase
MTFASTMTGLPTGGTLNVSYDAQGDLYLVCGSGLYHATQGATSFTQISGVQGAWGIGEGAPQPGSAVLTLYLAGEIGGQNGVYRSTNGGANWIRIDNPAQQYGYWNILIGDPRVFGRVYIGTGGRGIVYGDSPN